MAELGDLEAAVMAVMWDSAGALSVRGVLNQVQPERDIAYTTVMTVMDRLYRKGHLTRSASGNAFLYLPLASRADYTATLMTGALEADPDRTAALVHFTTRLSDADVQDLRRALRQTSRGGAGETGLS